MQMDPPAIKHTISVFFLNFEQCIYIAGRWTPQYQTITTWKNIIFTAGCSGMTEIYIYIYQKTYGEANKFVATSSGMTDLYIYRLMHI